MTARTPIEPRGMSRAHAAGYVGVTVPVFEALVSAGVMPSPKMAGSVRIWDRLALDRAIEDLPDAGNGAQDTAAADPWQNVAA